MNNIKFSNIKRKILKDILFSILNRSDDMIEQGTKVC